MNRLGIAIVVLLLPVVALSQGGSNYSVIGQGDQRRSVGALYDGMAGTSIAMPSDHGINIVNPALLGFSAYTRLQAGYRFNQHVVSEGNRSTAQNNGEIDAMMGLFAIDTAYGFGIAFGVLPITSVNYSVTRPLSTVADGTTISGTSSRTGTGGTSALHIGASGRIGDLYAGVSVQTHFGVITLTDAVSISGISERMRETTSLDVRAFVLRAGMYYRATSWLSFGAFVSGGPQAATTTVNEVRASIGSSLFVDSSITTLGHTSVPLSVGIGASVLSGRSRIGVDLEFDDYSSYTFNIPSNVTVSSALRMSIGYNLPAASNAPTFWERWGFRAGAGYQQQYYAVAGGAVADLFGAVGFDFPLGASATVDAGIQGGMRNTSGSSINEVVVRMTLSVSIGETWFKPFARD